MRKIISYFFQGILLIAPIFITIYVILKIVNWLDSFLANAVKSIFGMELPGVGFVAILVLITLVGFLSSTLIFKPVFKIIESLIEKTPLIKIIYTSLKDLFSAFVSEKKRFNQPVLVDINSAGLQKLGFITREDLSELNIKDKVAVYLPHSYNFSGNLFIVPKENITIIENLSSSDAMKFIISGGVTEMDSKS